MIAATCCCVGVGVSASDSVVIVDSTSATVNGRTTHSEVVYSIQDGWLRVQRHEASADATEVIHIYDSAAARVVILAPAKRLADVYDAVRAALQVEKALARQRITVDLQPTGKTRALLGILCEEYSFLVKAPLTPAISLTTSGTAWIARQGPGLDEYVRFFRGASTVLAAASIVVPETHLALNRSETELYRRIADLGGMPYALDIKVQVEGRGLTADSFRKMLTASRTVATTSVIQTAPFRPEMFTIPSGWMVAQK